VILGVVEAYHYRHSYLSKRFINTMASGCDRRNPSPPKCSLFNARWLRKS